MINNILFYANEVVNTLGETLKDENNKEYLLYSDYGLEIKKYPEKIVYINYQDKTVYENYYLDKVSFEHGKWEDILKEIYIRKDKIKNEELIEDFKVSKLLLCIDSLYDSYIKLERFGDSYLTYNSIEQIRDSRRDDEYIINLDESDYRIKLNTSFTRLYKSISVVSDKTNNKSETKVFEATIKNDFTNLRWENIESYTYIPGEWEKDIYHATLEYEKKVALKEKEKVISYLNEIRKI